VRAGRDQRPDQQATVGLDPDQDLPWVLSMVGQHGVQPGQPSTPLGSAGWPAAALFVQHGHLVMAFGPTDPDLDHTAFFAGRPARTPSRETMRRPNGPVLRDRHVIPPASRCCRSRTPTGWPLELTAPL
jgi:hypothetical protein